MITRKHGSYKVTKFAMKESALVCRTHSKTPKSSTGLWIMTFSCWKSVTISISEECSPSPPLIFRGIFYCSAFSAAKPGITLLALYK